jgi:hypothetical protein
MIAVEDDFSLDVLTVGADRLDVLALEFAIWALDLVDRVKHDLWLLV